MVSITRSRDLAPLAKECTRVRVSSDMFVSVMSDVVANIFILVMFSCMYIYMNIYLHASVVYLCAICSQRVPVKLFQLVYPVGRTRCVISFILAVGQ